MKYEAPPGGKLRYRLARLFSRHTPDAERLAAQIAADPRERSLLEAMKPATRENVRELAKSLKEELDRIPRGTPQTIANRARLCRIWADPVLREAFLATREQAVLKQRSRPRDRGKWLPDPKPTHSQILLRAHAKRRNIGAASSARFSDPSFRARALEQLARARARRAGSPRVAEAARSNASKPRHRRDI